MPPQLDISVKQMNQTVFNKKQTKLTSKTIPLIGHPQKPSIYFLQKSEQVLDTFELVELIWCLFHDNCSLIFSFFFFSRKKLDHEWAFKFRELSHVCIFEFSLNMHHVCSYEMCLN